MNIFKDYLKTERLCDSKINGVGVIEDILINTTDNHLIVRVAFDQERRDEYIDITNVKATGCKLYTFDSDFNSLYENYSKSYLQE